MLNKDLWSILKLFWLISNHFCGTNLNEDCAYAFSRSLPYFSVMKSSYARYTFSSVSRAQKMEPVCWNDKYRGGTKLQLHVRSNLSSNTLTFPYLYISCLHLTYKIGGDMWARPNFWGNVTSSAPKRNTTHRWARRVDWSSRPKISEGILNFR